MATVTQLAAVIARVAHRGQTRMDCVEPYINHPRRVAEALADQPGGTPQYVYAAAYLHDVLEDSSFEAQDLLDLGIPKETVDIVEIVSKRHGETYWTYLDRVISSGSAEALAVKTADVEDNLASLPPGHGLKARYEKTLRLLRGASV
ncbi:MAG: HD domain-containing protein [Planctomycetota bacterium]